MMRSALSVMPLPDMDGSGSLPAWRADDYSGYTWVWNER